MDKSSLTNNSQSPRKVLFLGNGILRALGNGAQICLLLFSIIHITADMRVITGISAQIHGEIMVQGFHMYLRHMVFKSALL